MKPVVTKPWTPHRDESADARISQLERENRSMKLELADLRYALEASALREERNKKRVGTVKL